LVSERTVLKVEDILEQLGIPREHYAAWERERIKKPALPHAPDDHHSLYLSTEPTYSPGDSRISKIV
jgi:hypothetical protein